MKYGWVMIAQLVEHHTRDIMHTGAKAMIDELGLMASASSRVPQWQHAMVTARGVPEEKVSWAPRNSTYIPSLSPTCSKGLSSSIWSPMHSSSEIFFSWKENLRTCSYTGARAMIIIWDSMKLPRPLAEEVLNLGRLQSSRLRTKNSNAIWQ